MVILWQSVIINRALLLKKTSFEVRFEAFLTGRRVAVFWKNGMKKFIFWAIWVHYPNGKMPDNVHLGQVANSVEMAQISIRKKSRIESDHKSK